MDANKIETMKAQRVEACIADVMARFPGESKATQARYFEEVHQHLAPLARQLERECDTLRAEVERLSAELSAGAARQGGNTSENMAVHNSAKYGAKTAETRMGSGLDGGALGSAPAAGTVEKDAAQRVEKRIHNIWEDAQIAWGDTCGGPPAYEIFAYSLISAMQEESAAMAHTKGKDAA